MKHIKQFKALGYAVTVGYEIANPKTCWWSADTKKKRRARHDNLIALRRSWYREERIYLYTLTLGRLQLGYLATRF